VTYPQNEPDPIGAKCKSVAELCQALAWEDADAEGLALALDTLANARIVGGERK